MMKGILTAAALLSTIGLTAHSPQVETAAVPNVRFNPVEVTSVPNVRFKPVEVASVPNVRFKPVQVASVPKDRKSVV